MKNKEIKKAVRERYAKTVTRSSSCCGPVQTSSCCGSVSSDAKSRTMGYTDEDLKSVPEGANLALGCGNPVAIASLQEGETVLDLGSGAGFDCFLAAKKVGDTGYVIGVDMTPEMIDKARENADKGNYRNVDFRLGEIEHLPAADNSVDVVISNCVINLSVDKGKVIREAYRVLKPGGRIAISDLALLKELPEAIRNSIDAYTGCIGGAILLDDYKRYVEEAGFRETKFTVKRASDYDADSREVIEKSMEQLPQDARSLTDYVVSVYIEGTK
ncbi:MAG: arsenite methyltransferase [candidate division WOR-3 bacterium]|nr:MAG: arsenite methyltransferase [candidate division WOR-3 bacterium]